MHVAVPTSKINRHAEISWDSVIQQLRNCSRKPGWLSEPERAPQSPAESPVETALETWPRLRRGPRGGAPRL